MLVLQSVAQAQSAEEFYKGKTIELAVSASPGGSSDFFGRQLAMFWGKHIPGNPEIVVTNKSGAGGMVAGAELQNAAPKDGTYVGFQQHNNLYRPLLEGQPSAGTGSDGTGPAGAWRRGGRPCQRLAIF